MQIALTFRNNLWNVKRRVLHTLGSAMYYITRARCGAYETLHFFLVAIPRCWGFLPRCGMRSCGFQAWRHKSQRPMPRARFFHLPIRQKNNYSGHFSLKTQCTARCSRACDSAEGEHLIYNRAPANSRLSEKNKNRKNPLRLMQNGSDEPLIQWLAENPASKLGNFQPVTASPYRVLHQAQGDKQEINPFSSEEVHHPVVYFH